MPLIRRASHETHPDDVVIEVDHGQQAEPAVTTDDPAVQVLLSESQTTAVVVTLKREQVTPDCREMH